MLITLDEAKELLRLDNDFNDDVIAPLVDAVPGYIQSTTGMTTDQQMREPLAKVVSGFLITLWYNAEGTDSNRLSRVIDSLLTTLSLRTESDDDVQK